MVSSSVQKLRVRSDASSRRDQGSGVVIQEANQRLELRTARTEPIHHGRLAERAAGVRSLRLHHHHHDTEKAGLRHRRVKSNSTGVRWRSRSATSVVDEGHEQRRLRHPLYDSSAEARARRRAPDTAEHRKTPARGSPEAINRPQAPLHRPARHPASRPTSGNLPDLQGFPRKLQTVLGSLQRAAPPARREARRRSHAPCRLLEQRSACRWRSAWMHR